MLPFNDFSIQMTYLFQGPISSAFTTHQAQYLKTYKAIVNKGKPIFWVIIWKHKKPKTTLQNNGCLLWPIH